MSERAGRSLKLTLEMNKQIHRTRAVVARGAEAEALLERHALKAGGADFCSLIMCFVHGKFSMCVCD
jgi:hypothetical protein